MYLTRISSNILNISSHYIIFLVKSKDGFSGVTNNLTSLKCISNCKTLMRN